MGINFSVIWSLAVVHCAWPLLFDASCVFYLVSEVSGVDVLVQGTAIFVGASAGCLLVARLVRGWWLWLLTVEVVLLVLVLVSWRVVAVTLQLYVESVKSQHGEHIHNKRKQLRME